MEISRRQMMALAALAGRLRADPPGRGSELWDYFEGELTAADQRRRERLTQVRTKTALAELGERVRTTLAAGIGEFPQRTPLQARQVGEIKHAGYLIEKIIFESRPQYYVTANLYRPKSSSVRRAAVVQTCGHYENGKAAPDYVRACAGLALKGFVALIFDPMGQGERIMFRNGAGRPMYKGATGEHVAAGRPALLLGRTLANYRIWDIMRALDYLESRPDVDAGRMGLLGHSGGGMMTLLATPLEPRIRAAMSCCAVTSFYHKTKALLMADPEQIVPGVYAQGIDHPELIAAVAPRAFLIGAVLRDYVPLDGTRRTYAEAKPLFEVAGVSGNLGLVESDNEHKLDLNLRQACYGWMQQHLLGERGDPREPDISVDNEEALRCTPTGCVMDLEGSRSVFDLNREEARRLSEILRGKAPAAGIQSRLALAAPPAARTVDGGLISAPGIHLSTTLWPAGGRRDILLLLAAERGRNASDTRELAGHLENAGFPVLAIDLRGWGDTRPDMPEKKAKFSWEEFFAFRSFELGKPLLGMRVFDLLAAKRRMAGTYASIYLLGIGSAGLVALHAAALDREIPGVGTWRTLDRWVDVLERLETTEPCSSFVPGALQAYDLPELRRALDCPVAAVDAHDAAGHLAGVATADPARAILQGLKLA